jgi:hypothetical protein
LIQDRRPQPGAVTRRRVTRQLRLSLRNAYAKSQQHVLLIIALYGPLTDEAMLYHLQRNYPMSPSGARTRRAELVARGLVYDTGKRETLASGRKAVVWGARSNG